MNTHGRLHVETFVAPMYQENAYLLECADHPDAWILDPGFPPQPAWIAEAVKDRELTPRAIRLTHCHVDHIAGVEALRALLPEVPLICPRDERHMLTDPMENLSATAGFPIVAPDADALCAPGDELTLGDLKWRVLDVSGHSPGGLAYYCHEAGVVFVGDAIIPGSIGRYDFHHSNREKLLRNIADNLLTLPDETVLYSGHGPESTIGHERQFNLVLLSELRG